MTDRYAYDAEQGFFVDMSKPNEEGLGEEMTIDEVVELLNGLAEMEFGPNDGAVIFHESGDTSFLLPKSVDTESDDPVPDHIVLASAFGIAATNEEWCQKIVDWFFVIAKNAKKNGNGNGGS